MMQIALQPAQLEFLQKIEQAWQHKQFERLIISQYQGEITDLEKITITPVLLKQILQLKVVYRHKQKDITKNYIWSEFQTALQDWILHCKQFNLLLLNGEIQLKNKKNQWKLTENIKHVAQTSQIIKTEHNREKKRWVDQDSLFLHVLGITDKQANIIPSMARKWKQINKFVEIFAHAMQSAHLTQDRSIHVVDFGSGKGYLTFAVYDYLAKLNGQPQVTGVELRDDLVQFCQQAAQQAQFEHLNFFQGDVRSYQPAQTDIMIALHACDIATDFAIHTGIRLDAKIIMCAPCCHKELRPQMHSPDVLKPMLNFGVHTGQQAEMLTDSLRALLLQAYGYETKILEFVSLEHTSKNKMILATRREDFDKPDIAILNQIQLLKSFYGIQQQTLESLLEHDS